MKKKLKQYEISNNGYQQLSDEDFSLLETARTVVMWYLEKSYGRTAENKQISLNEAAAWSGFIIAMEDENTYKIEIGGLSGEDLIFYKSLFLKFKIAIESIKIDENDELGLKDEIIQVANLMLKYKYIILLKRKKKKFFEKIINFLSFK